MEGPIDRDWAQRSVGGALKEARHRRREDAPGGRRTCVPAELPGVVLSAFEHHLDRTARTYLSFIGAPESDRLPYTACREPSSWYTKRGIAGIPDSSFSHEIES